MDTYVIVCKDKENSFSDVHDGIKKRYEILFESIFDSCYELLQNPQEISKRYVLYDFLLLKSFFPEIKKTLFSKLCVTEKQLCITITNDVLILKKANTNQNFDENITPEDSTLFAKNVHFLCLKNKEASETEEKTKTAMDAFDYVLNREDILLFDDKFKKFGSTVVEMYDNLCSINKFICPKSRQRWETSHKKWEKGIEQWKKFIED